MMGVRKRSSRLDDIYLQRPRSYGAVTIRKWNKGVADRPPVHTKTEIIVLAEFAQFENAAITSTI